MRIAIAGFQHETNTSAPTNAGVAEFSMADSWPELLTGSAVIDNTQGMNLPIAGAIAAVSDEVELIPIVWCAAEPSGPVTDEAFNWIAQMITEGVLSAGQVDGVYLDLHGAMVTQSLQDGEGELLKRLRAVLGDIPIGVSLDLHANITPAMVRMATVITVYRTYPHLDMSDTGGRCIQRLINAIQGQPTISAFRQVPFLIPLHAQYTGQSPCRVLYQQLDDPAIETGEWVELAMGFSAADIYDCGPSIIAYAQNEKRASQLADQLSDSVQQHRSSFDTSLLSAAGAVRRAMASTSTKPVVIADVQDNPGAGGTSDTTGILAALISSKAQGAVLGVLCDSETASFAHSSGVDASIDTNLGAKSGLANHSPISSRFKVLAVSDGEIAYTGEMYGGGIATLGPSCLLAIEDSEVNIRIVVSSIRIQCLDLALFTHFGVELTDAKIIVVKSTVHHRAEFEPIASEVLNVAAPGAFACQLRLDQYANLRPCVECL